MKRIAIIGPTGVGKTALGIELALRLRGKIISCDSRQVFKDMDIGTAKPPLRERKAIPHGMLDFLEPTQLFSAGAFARQARGEIEKDPHEGPVWLVGGSGFYLKALIDGVDQIPEPGSDAGLRRRIESEVSLLGLGFVYAQLKRMDPERALKVHPNDRYRVVRSFETALSRKRTPSSPLCSSPKKEEPWLILGLLPPSRDWLIERLRIRAERMIQSGFLMEVEKLKDAGFDRFPPFRLTPGYPEALKVLQGEQSVSWLKEAMVRAHRGLAKRQLTFFRHKLPGVVWIDAQAPLALALQTVRRFLEQ